MKVSATFKNKMETTGWAVALYTSAAARAEARVPRGSQLSEGRQHKVCWKLRKLTLDFLARLYESIGRLEPCGPVVFSIFPY